MRNQVSLKFLLLLLVGLAQRSTGSQRPEPLSEVSEIILRELENAAANATEDASEWFGGNEEKEVASSKNETDAAGEDVDSPEPVEETPAGNDAAAAPEDSPSDTNSTLDQDLETSGTENPENWDTTPETPPPTEGDEVGDDLAGEGDDEFGGEGDDEFGGEGDDEFGEGDDVEGEGEGEWGEFEPEEEGTKAPYVPPTGDDPFANGGTEEEKIENEWHPDSDLIRPPETIQEMEHDPNVIIAISCAIFVGFCLAICSVQQVIENPDGCCASLCRCAVKFFCFFFKILCFPCRMCCGNKDRRTHDLMIGSSDSYTHDLELT